MTYIMNRATADVGLKTREVEDSLKVKVKHELPMDRTVQLCVNRGDPIALVEPRSEFGRSIAALAKQVAPQTPAPAPSQRRRILSLAKA
jgi:MinD-like ATPase involved in chromosome partitioning or flagellar assembly